jgi:DNA polymerase III subunit gamma/tau
MSYQALARKYRPQSFRDMIGQEPVVRTLQNAIEQNRIHHAYLFSGVRGVGKTTAARIFAKALNCAKGPTAEPDNECSICREITEGIDMDVREIDAATYTGVDNVRELRDVTQFQPARDRYRIFIIDEAHMLSAPAWNALLKIIEEPPAHVIFMFATTEMQKVPATILSRVQKFSLRKVTVEEVIERLRQISESEGIAVDREALEMIARRGEGSVRDSLSLLDQIIAFGGKSITAAEVSAVLGLSDLTFFARVIRLVADGDHAAILAALQEAAGSGRDFKLLYRDLLNFVRNLLLVSGGADPAMLSLVSEDLAVVRDVASNFSYTDLLRIANLLLRDDETVNRAEHQRLAVEIALLKAATFPRLKSVEEALGSAPAAAGVGTRSARLAPRPEPSRPAKETAPPPQPERSPAPARGTARTAPPSAPSRAAASPAPQEIKSQLSPDAASETATDIGAFIRKVAAKRRMLASYLEQAKGSRREGAALVFEFDPAQQLFVDSLNDAAPFLGQAATDAFGSPTQVRATAKPLEVPAGRRADDAPNGLLGDPILNALQKHLGGELVQPKKRKEAP